MNHRTRMGAAADQACHAREQAGQACLLILAQKEARRQHVVEAVKHGCAVIAGAFILYALMLVACL